MANERGGPAGARGWARAHRANASFTVFGALLGVLGSVGYDVLLAGPKTESAETLRVIANQDMNRMRSYLLVCRSETSFNDVADFNDVVGEFNELQQLFSEARFESVVDGMATLRVKASAACAPADPDSEVANESAADPVEADVPSTPLPTQVPAPTIDVPPAGPTTPETQVVNPSSRPSATPLASEAPGSTVPETVADRIAPDGGPGETVEPMPTTPLPTPMTAASPGADSTSSTVDPVIAEVPDGPVEKIPTLPVPTVVVDDE